MKTLMTATAIVAMLSTPALANKTPRKPIMSECEVNQQKYDEKMVLYHLDQIEMLLEEMRQNILREYPKKPVNNNKHSFKNKS